MLLKLVCCWFLDGHELSSAMGFLEVGEAKDLFSIVFCTLLRCLNRKLHVLVHDELHRRLERVTVFPSVQGGLIVERDCCL